MIRKITVVAAACVFSSAAWCIDDVAVGFHLVQTHISAARVFSTAFQFAEHVGAGVRSGKYSFGLHAQHLSNGGVTQPNPGINFLLVRVQYALE